MDNDCSDHFFARNLFANTLGSPVHVPKQAVRGAGRQFTHQIRQFAEASIMHSCSNETDEPTDVDLQPNRRDLLDDIADPKGCFAMICLLTLIGLLLWGAIEWFITRW